VLALGRPGRPDAADLSDPRPQAAGRAQLGDGQELVGARRVTELKLPGRLVGGQARLGQLPQVADGGADGQAKLLRGGGAGLVVRQRVDGQRPDAGELGRAAGGQAARLGQLRLGADVVPGAGEEAERAAPGNSAPASSTTAARSR